jgi:hypothetical protein
MIAVVVACAVLSPFVWMYIWWWDRISAVGWPNITFVFLTHAVATGVEVLVPVMIFFVLRRADVVRMLAHSGRENAQST